MRGRTLALVAAVLLGAIAVSEAQLGTGSTLVRAAVTSITGTANEVTATQSGSAYTLSLPSALTLTGKTVTGGTLSGSAVALGTGSGTGTLCAVATTDTTAVGNVDGGEDTLMSYNLPANALGGNGQYVRIVAFGDHAANANDKTIKLHFGATQVSYTAVVNTNALGWRFVAEVIRTGASTQIAIFSGSSGGTHYNAYYTTPAETLTGAVTIKATGQSGSNASNDIVQRGMIVEVCNR